MIDVMSELLQAIQHQVLGGRYDEPLNMTVPDRFKLVEITDVIHDEMSSSVFVHAKAEDGTEHQLQLSIELCDMEGNKWPPEGNAGPVVFEATYRGEHQVKYRVRAEDEDEARRLFESGKGEKTGRSDFDEYELECVELIDAE